MRDASVPARDVRVEQKQAKKNHFLFQTILRRTGGGGEGEGEKERGRERKLGGYGTRFRRCCGLGVCAKLPTLPARVKVRGKAETAHLILG